jgi:prepilin-type N-terminal cleavage/methylation domain-containing protein
MNTSRAHQGLSMVELLIAITIFAVGILALVGFQTSSLATNRQAQTINQLTRLATTEMELRRQTLVAEAGPALPCVTTVPSGFNQAECTVEIVSCGIVISQPTVDRPFGSEFACGTGLPFATYRVTVTAAGRGESVKLQSLYGGFYVSGSLGGN